MKKTLVKNYHATVPLLVGEGGGGRFTMAYILVLVNSTPRAQWQADGEDAGVEDHICGQGDDGIVVVEVVAVKVGMRRKRDGGIADQNNRTQLYSYV